MTVLNLNVNGNKNGIILFSESAKVTIVGQPEAQWKAQFCIFDKLKQEGWFGQEEGRLTSQITIPGILVGRVIGKGGVNVRELQVSKITRGVDLGDFISLPSKK